MILIENQAKWIKKIWKLAKKMIYRKRANSWRIKSRLKSRLRSIMVSRIKNIEGKKQYRGTLSVARMIKQWRLLIILRTKILAILKLIQIAKITKLAHPWTEANKDKIQPSFHLPIIRPSLITKLRLNLVLLKINLNWTLFQL